jgi:ABC-2 type transport system permease protein
VSEAVGHSAYIAWRLLRNLLRQPWFVVAIIAQPIILLLLTASLFSEIATLPGFTWDSYVSFLSPGLVVMGALFAGGWSGTGVIGDIDRGVMDRLLVTPMRRGALVAGKLVQLAVLVLVQSALLIVLAEVRGADFHNGAAGLLGLVAASVLIALPVGAVSTAIALTVRTIESLIALVTMVLLPAIFVSTLFMPEPLMPDWIAAVAPYNPVDWAISAGRAAVGTDPDWGWIAARLAGLAALTVVCVAVAVRAFRSYVRSV